MWEPLLAGQRRTRRLLLATHQQAALSPCLTKSRNYLSHMADDNSESCGDQPREPNDFCSSGIPSRCRWFLNWVGMSATGHEQTSRHVRVMSVIPLKADIHQHGLHVRLVP